MAILTSISKLGRSNQLSYREIQARWKHNPSRLINRLGLLTDLRGTGICCPFCGSGSGEHGTGMQFYLTKGKGYLRLKCFGANCEANLSPIDLVTRLLPQANDYDTAVALLSDLYTPATSQYDTDSKPCVYRSRNSFSDLAPASVLPTYHASIQGRIGSPSWQQRLATLMGLPASAFDRPDIGKGFLANPDGSTDALDPTCGDMVTYNLVNGIPHSVKVRYTPGLNSYQGFMLFYDAPHACFHCTPLNTAEPQHAFRMTGSSGTVCFGHDTIKDAELVVIVEGQSDVLAVVAAFQELGFNSYTAIGRDSAGHRLRSVDLNALAGKSVIYASDYDTIGSAIDAQNCALLQGAGCTVYQWAAPSAAAKDPRAFYINNGPHKLVSSLLAAPIATPYITETI